MFIYFRKYSYWLFATWCMVSCTLGNDQKVPEGILGEQYFSTILADVLLLEAHTSRNTAEYEGKAADVMLRYNYPMIDEKYGLKDSQLIKSYQYYLSDPEALIRIMNHVQDTLDVLFVQVTSTEAISGQDTLVND
jgi:hypothetical protein